MMDLGQPMHAFDAQQLTTNNKQITIQVRNAKDGEEFVTLDEQVRKLDSSMLMICAEDRSLAIAGVMGGLHSGITDQTDTIVFESANFDAAAIRSTSAKLALRTDSSARFEKSLDPNLTELALQKAVELVLQICPEAKVVSKVVDQSKFSLKQGPIQFDVKLLERKAGIVLAEKEVIKILEQLGFEVKGKKDELSVRIPSWRATKDISIAEDLVEEIIRIYGYDKIPAVMPVFPIDPPEQNKVRQLERQVKQLLVSSLQYTEVYNYSFVSGAQIEKIGDAVDQYIALDNPLSKEKPYLRRCLLLNLLENLEHNQAGRGHLNLFEIGKVFRSEEPGFKVDINGGALLPGQDSWLTTVCQEKKNSTVFWEARKVVELLAQTIVPSLSVARVETVGVGRHPARAASLVIEDKVVGSVYELHPMVAQNFGLEGRVGVVKLNLSLAADCVRAEKKYATLSEFPSVERDVAFVVKKNISHQDIVSTLSQADPLLKSVELFDVYEGERVGVENKSMAYRLIYQDSTRTLVTEEVEKVHANIIKILKENFKAEIR